MGNMRRMSDFSSKSFKQPALRLKHFTALPLFFCRMAAIASMAMLLASMPFFATTALAHPHIFVDATLHITIDKHNRVQKLDQSWRFDRLFSASVILDFDKNGDRRLDKDELKNVSGVIKKSLAEFNFFQSVKANGKDIPLAPPQEIHADIVEGRLVLTFESKPRDPLMIEQGGSYQFSLYDPSFYVAVTFQKNTDLEVEGLPAFCKIGIDRPDSNEILSKNRAAMTEDFFNDPNASLDLAYQLASKLNVSCKK